MLVYHFSKCFCWDADLIPDNRQTAERALKPDSHSQSRNSILMHGYSIRLTPAYTT